MPSNRITVKSSNGRRSEADEKSGCCYATRLQSSLDDVSSLSFYKALVAEFLGTFILVITSLGSTVQGWSGDALDVVQISLTFGFSVASAVWIIGHVSGGHINPAVTIGMFITRRISLIRAIMYMALQSAGAIAAAYVLKAVTPSAQRGGLGSTTLSSGVTTGMGFGVEFFITLFLVLTVFASCDNKRRDLAGSFPLSIGLAVAMGHLWAVEFTGSSMNPARSLGPAIAMDVWTDHWVYWAGPLGGGVAAGLIYDILFSANASLQKTKDWLTSADFNNDNYSYNMVKTDDDSQDDV